MSLTNKIEQAQKPKPSQPKVAPVAKPQPKPQGHPMAVVSFPEEQVKVSLGFRSGFDFGLGAGVAITIVLPLIVGVLGCMAWIALMIFGAAITGLVGGG